MSLYDWMLIGPLWAIAALVWGALAWSNDQAKNLGK